jgi:hypothetical protein
MLRLWGKRIWKQQDEAVHEKAMLSRSAITKRSIGSKTVK